MTESSVLPKYFSSLKAGITREIDIIPLADMSLDPEQNLALLMNHCQCLQKLDMHCPRSAMLRMSIFDFSISEANYPVCPPA